MNCYILPDCVPVIFHFLNLKAFFIWKGSLISLLVHKSQIYLKFAYHIYFNNKSFILTAIPHIIASYTLIYSNCLTFCPKHEGCFKKYTSDQWFELMLFSYPIKHVIGINIGTEDAITPNTLNIYTYFKKSNIISSSHPS